MHAVAIVAKMVLAVMENAAINVPIKDAKHAAAKLVHARVAINAVEIANAKHVRIAVKPALAQIAIATKIANVIAECIENR